MPYLSVSIQSRDAIIIQTEGEQPWLKTMRNQAQLLEAYQGCRYPIHGSSTLDEWYYHFGSDENSVMDRNSRNESQVTTRCLLGDTSVEERETWPLIRVNQLWIWTIANSMAKYYLYHRSLLLTHVTRVDNNLLPDFTGRKHNHAMGGDPKSSRQTNGGWGDTSPDSLPS
jgi:hypothetical protein